MVARFVMKFKKQRIISIIAVVTMAIVLSCAFIACDKVGSQKPSKTNSENVDQKVMIKSIQNGKVDGLTLSLEIDNTVEDVDLSGMITTSKDCSWQLYTSKIATSADAIVTKMIVPKNGNNTYYIVVTSADEKTNRTYTLNVWKNYYATLSFYANGSFYTSEHVLTHTTYGSGPSCSVAGYTFNGWGCDGYYVTESKSFNANLTPLTYTAKFDSNGGSPVSDKTATFNKDLSLPSPYKTGYTFLGWYLNDNLYKDSIKYTFTNDVTFTARWQLAYYKVIIKSENEICGTVNAYNGSKNYGDPVSLTATTNPGYIFIGWFANGTKISSELSINVNVPDYDVTYTAKWIAVDENIKNYKLRQTADGYIITDVIDKTVSKVIIPDVVVGIDNGAFSACTKIKTIIGNATNVSKIANQAKPSSFSVNITSGTRISEHAFSYCYGLINITIPDSVTSIGSYAFAGCKEITSVTIPDSVTSIGEYAFYECTGLTSVIIGNGVTSIGNYAFRYCTELTSITIADGNTKYHSSSNCLIETASKTLILGCKTSVIPSDDSVTSIGDNAFRNCSGLTSITIPDSVTSIGWAAFDCSGITSVTIGNSVTSIGDSAFYDCNSLTSITIPDSVTSIGSSAFYNCKNLQDIYITDIAAWCNISRLYYLMEYGASNKKLYINNELATSITIPNGVTEIPSYAFRGCSSLTSITIPNSVTSIGSSAFSGCTGLTSVTIPDSVTSIGSSTFYNCSGLTSIIIPDSVTSIGYFAFYNCTVLTNITIPDSVTSIGKEAFYNCSGLTNITIPDSVTSIGKGAFSGCSSLESITIPFIGAKAGVTSSDTDQYPFGYIFGTSSYAGGVATKQDYYGSSTSGTTETTYYIPSSLKFVTVTGGNILYGAFNGCKGLTSITIPDSVTNIGNSAFSWCTGLTSVTIGNGVTSIGAEAFVGCSRLTSITIPDSVTSIGDSAFQFCSGLTSITIPDSVTSVGNGAFYGCTGLTSIAFNGTIAQWNAISKGDNWENNVPATEVVCTDGTVSI